MPRYEDFIKRLAAQEAQRHTLQGFTTVRVSETADELIEAHKQASFACGAADLAHASAAYSHLSVTADTLYTYVQSLEVLAGIPRNVIKRF